MANENSSKEGKLPKSREIYYYVLMGHIYYWINSLLPKKRIDSNSTTKNDQNHPNNQNNQENQINKTRLKLDIIKEVAGGDITNNIEIMSYIPENSLNNKILDAAKTGAPLITVGDGSKPRVMITAGVHGNELPPQIAAIKLINYLQNMNLRGTIYIIPFIAPLASEANSKLFNNENLNLAADVPGTPTNLVFKIAQNLDITSLADCHGTSTDPAKTSVIYYPSIKSSKIAVHINKKSNSTLLALAQEPGMLITLCNLHGIPSVICEVESPDGVASPPSIEISYNQMKAFLSYHQIL